MALADRIGDRLGLGRGEVLTCAALLAVFVGLRVALMLGSPVELYHPEEYLGLRLWRQLAAGHAVGPLSAYAYGAGTGIDGGGALVQALLYVPLLTLLGPGQLAVKVMALLWATVGALAAAVVGRRLLGVWGAAAALAGLVALPPSLLVLSSISWANHFEGAVGVLVLAAVLLRVCGLEDRSRAWTVLLGALLVGVPWYSPLAVVPALLLAASLPWALRGRWRGHGAALVAGLAVASVPAALVGGPGAGGGGLARGAALGVLAHVPTYDVSWPGRWSPGPGAARLAHALVSVIAWSGLGLLAWRGARSPGGLGIGLDRGRVAVAVALPLVALVQPALLAALGGAVPRRLSPVLLLWGLGMACWIHLGWTWRGSVRTAALGATVAAVVLAATPSALLVAGGQRPVPGFEPARIALQPAASPVQEVSVGLSDVAREHLPALDAMGADARLQSKEAVAAALRGFDRAAGGARQPLALESARCMEAVAAHDLAEPVAWEYLGRALASGCAGEVARQRCALAPTGELAAACLVGVAAQR